VRLSKPNLHPVHFLTPFISFAIISADPVALYAPGKSISFVPYQLLPPPASAKLNGGWRLILFPAHCPSQASAACADQIHYSAVLFRLPVRSRFSLTGTFSASGYSGFQATGF